jgi:MscS family membrane protein
MISKIVFKKIEEKKESFVNTLKRPLAIFFLVLGLFIAVYINVKSLAVIKVFKIAIIILICWGVINYLSANIGSFLKFTDGDDTTNLTAIKFISNILKIVVVIFGVVMVVSELGYNINGLLTGLGVGGLAISLAAQDAVSNLISGFIIVFEKPFVVGDMVITDNIQGTVIDITMRSTTLRTLEDSVVTLPNSSVANSSIVNLSRIEKRLIEFDFGLLYSTPNELIEKCIADIKEYLISNENILDAPIRVDFTKLDDSSLNISVYCYSNKADIGEHLKVLSEVDLGIKKIIEDNGAGFAYPSTSVYIEKK